MKRALRFTLLLIWLMGLSPALAKSKKPVEKEPEKTSDVEPEILEDVDFAVYFHLGGLTSNQQTLTQALFSQCNCPDQQTFGTIGGGIYVMASRWMLEFEGQGMATGAFTDDRFSTTIGAGMGLLNTGWNLSPLKGLRLYPLIGMGVGVLNVRFANRVKSPSFAEMVADPGRSGEMYNTLFLLNIAVGADLKWIWFDDFGFLVGARLGYLWTPFTSSDWEAAGSSNFNTVRGGPETALSGPYFRLQFGL